MAKQAVIGDAETRQYIRTRQSGGFLTCGARLLASYQNQEAVLEMLRNGHRDSLYADPAQLQSQTPMNQALHQEIGARPTPGGPTRGPLSWEDSFWKYPEINNPRWHFRYLFTEGQWLAGRSGTNAVAPLAQVMAVLKPRTYPLPAGTAPGDFSRMPEAVSLALG